MMILQGVGLHKPHLGVCYANDPKKEGGGYTTPPPPLDLTTSLGGDFPASTFSPKMAKMYHLRKKKPSQYILAQNGLNVPAESKKAPGRYIFVQSGQNVPADK